MTDVLSRRFGSSGLLAVLWLLLSTAFATAAGQVTLATSVDPVDARPGQTITVSIALTVMDGYHAQSHTPHDENYLPLTVKLDSNAAVDVGTIQYPPGMDENYPALGVLNVYTGTVTVKVPVTIKRDVPPGPLTLSGKVRYQACDDNVCYPPQKPAFTATVTVNTAAGPATVPTSAPAAAPTTAPAAAGNISAPDDSGGLTVFGLALTDRSYVLAFSAAFLVGIIFNAVPCVLPVIPLKIGGFYEAAQHDRGRCFLLGAAFSAGLVASFAVLAVLVVGLGKLSWGQQFQNPYFTAVIIAVLVVMAISQFGLINFNLPTAAYAFSPRHDTYVGNVLFGVLTAALSTPCTIGLFGVLIAWSLKQPPVLGVMTIIIVGCGMAFPYLLLSAFPQVVRRFPRTGPVGEIIKQTLAFLVLATAFYFARPFLHRLLTPPAFWWMLFAFVPIAGLFLVLRTGRAVGTRRAVLIAAAISLLVTVPSALAVSRLASDPYDWQPYTDKALADAVASGHPVLIDFTADWCGNCHYIEAFRLNTPEVVKAVRDSKTVMIKADITDNEHAAAWPLLSRLSPAGSIPLTAVYRPHEAHPRLLTGIYNTSDLAAALQ